MRDKLGLEKLVWYKKGKESKWSVKKLIETGKISSKKDFDVVDGSVKKDIENLRFIFINMSSDTPRDIKNFEHFAISVLEPRYND